MGAPQHPPRPSFLLSLAPIFLPPTRTTAMTDPLEKLITKTFLPIPETPYKEWPEDLRREARLAPEDSDLVLEVFNLDR
ncbi:uncharacterized protein SCHCODRAFT_02617622 [Schizophyllum commune H4-8]|uniref:uncharacterized protein n=1 Tax=Schizophyllum commune (strain H4-8 / FGSC 9210) TaxID=578458 RepID=UPI00215FCBE9|nr:uncharacterized protein SCHCODRAFT_02617622 [Schizophyllum commune H4-8]KAI5894706.1 hypothetical protein SCHCODRAFT_02617622 [Schizophyllum commune H4-8]